MFSPLIMGCMRWGIWGANLNTKQIQSLIETCLEEGFTSFDHADIYGDYTTESHFGKAWGEMSIGRENIELISKCGIILKDKNHPVKHYNYQKSHILQSVDNSLKNLKTDYLDALLLHRPSPLIDAQEIAEVFQNLKDSGKVKQFGVSNFSTAHFDQINQYFPLMTNQVEVSVNHTQAFFDGTLDQLSSKNLRPMAWSVLGNYFSENTDQNIRLKSIITTLSEKYNVEASLLLIAFLLKHPSKILPIVGSANADRIRSYQQALTINLEDQDWFAILEASRGHEVD